MYHIFGLKQGFSLFKDVKTKYTLAAHNGNVKPRLSICVVGFFTPQNIYHTPDNEPYNTLIGFGGADGGAVSAAYWRYSRAAGRFNVTTDPKETPISLVIGQAYCLLFEVYDSHIKTTLGYYGKDTPEQADYKMNGGKILKTVLPLNARFALPAPRNMRLTYKLIEQE